MGKKRRRTEDEIDRLAKKLRKLEKRLRKDKDDEASISRESEAHALPNPEDGTSDMELEVMEPEMALSPPQPETAASPTAAETDAYPAQPQASATGLIKPAETAELAITQESINFEELLGEIPNKEKTYGPDIQEQLAVRLESITTQGLSREVTKELFGKYLVPQNAKLIDAPELNPETRAATSESMLKRDKGIETRQKQLASAIASIGGAISVLFQTSDTNAEMIKTLMDALRMLCVIQYNDSNTRRNFILFNLKKDIKDEMQKQKIDSYLFGKGLGETLKTAKIISKSGADLKPATSQPSSSFNNKNKPDVRKNLNWKAPPLNRRPRGNPRAKEPAQNQRNQPGRLSQPYRAPAAPPRSRR